MLINDEDAAGTTGWAELLPELLTVIMSKLPGKDQPSASLVCRSWRNSVSALPNRYPPCLTRYHPRTRAWKFHKHGCNGSTFQTSFPELHGSEIRCSRHGWLLMTRPDQGSFFFFDPCSRRTIHLPPMTDNGFTTFGFFGPPTEPGCTVLGLGDTGAPTAIDTCVLRRGEAAWEVHEHLVGGPEFPVSLAAPVMHAGRAHFVDKRGNVARLDVGAGGKLSVRWRCLRKRSGRLEGRIKEHYLVETDDGGLMGVFVFGDVGRVRVYRLSDEDGRWDPVWEGVGEDNVVYLSQGSSFIGPASEGKGNTACLPKFYKGCPVVYFFRDGKYRLADGGDTGGDETVYALEHGKYRGDAAGLQSFNSAAWFVPEPARWRSGPMDDSKGDGNFCF
ncbi:F-box family protein [Striga asiatica]|uniref:F-box family protein n=1 Tax=Striga asiatica TaxID=4170 RepID=A0A5A7PY95_STRAF|nr:F-box family protein [Striga asiatica]